MARQEEKFEQRPNWMVVAQDGGAGGRIESLVESTEDSFAYWDALMAEYAPGSIERAYCDARRYVSLDGFYEFCREIVGYADMYEPLHRPVCRLVSEGIDEHGVTGARTTMLQVFRNSFKSSIATKGYGMYLMARDTTLNMQCNVRILLGSEVVRLSNAFARSIKTMVEHTPAFTGRYGFHRPHGSRNRTWKDNFFISALRTDFNLDAPTIMTIGVESGAAGWHYDAVLGDDQQAERTSATETQIDQCFDFYQLLHSLPEPNFRTRLDMLRIMPMGPRFQQTGTRWHTDDVYARILAEEAEFPDVENPLALMVKPIKDVETGELAFPTRFDEKTIEGLRLKHGSIKFGAQYMLDPKPPESRSLRLAWFGKTPDKVMEKPKDYGRPKIGSDWAYTEVGAIRRGFSRNSSPIAFTVHLAGIMDRQRNVYLFDQFRGQVSKHVGYLELKALYQRVGACQVVIQRHDRSQIKETLKEKMAADGYRMLLDWISYPATSNKIQRIDETIGGLAEAGKLWLPDGKEWDWLRREIEDHPGSYTRDGLDAFCNLIRGLRPPMHIEKEVGADEDYPDRQVADRVLELRKTGRILGLDGRVLSRGNPWRKI